MPEERRFEPPGNAGRTSSLGLVCRSLAARLPNLIEAAVGRYLEFAGTKPPDDPKTFAAYSSARRAAIQHVDQLLKLTRAIDGSRPTAVPEEDVETLIARAEAAVKEAAADT